MLLEAWDNIQVKVPNVDNIWNKLREIKMSIKNWYQLKGARDSCNILHLEEEIERLKKRLQVNVHEENIKKLVLEMYRLEEQV